MILVDANILLYARVRGLPQHERARKWLDDRLCESAKVGLPWPSLLSFVRISTNPRVFKEPDSIGDAWAQVGQWLESPSAWIPAPTDEHLSIADRLVRYCSRSEDIPDMHLAALAVEHGLTLCSTDSDFLRYEGLNFSNPLAKSP